MDEVLEAMADDIGLDISGQLPSEKGDSIPEPEVEQLETGDWIFTWADAGSGEMYRSRVSNATMKQGDLVAYLTVAYRRTETAKPVTLLAHKQWRLRSNSSQTDHVRALNRRVKREWDGMLTQASAYIEEHFHFGDEAEWLDDVADPGPVEYMVQPVVEKGQHTVIAADGGSLKSFLAGAFAVSLGEGTSICPGLGVNETAKTLYLDYETDKYVHRRRYRLLLNGIGQAKQSRMVMYKRLYAPLIDAADEIRQLIVKHGFKFVVIDSASRAVGGETVSEGDTIPYFNAVSSWGVTALTIAHKSKSNSSGPAGNAQWRNQARSYWEVAKDQVEGDNVVQIALKHEKSNNGQLFRPLGFRVEFDETAIRFYKTDPATSAVIAEKLPLVDQIYHYLLENANSTAAEIGDALGQSQNRVNNILKSQEGKIFRGSEERRNRRWSVLSNPVINPVDKGNNPPLKGGYIYPVNKPEKEEAVTKKWWED